MPNQSVPSNVIEIEPVETEKVLRAIWNSARTENIMYVARMVCRRYLSFHAGVYDHTSLDRNNFKAFSFLLWKLTLFSTEVDKDHRKVNIIKLFKLSCSCSWFYLVEFGLPLWYCWLSMLFVLMSYTYNCNWRNLPRISIFMFRRRDETQTSDAPKVKSDESAAKFDRWCSWKARDSRIYRALST